MAKNTKTIITEVRTADWNHNVVTVTGGEGASCKRPCKRCPWRKDAVGEFPAEAFRLSGILRLRPTTCPSEPSAATRVVPIAPRFAQVSWWPALTTT